MKLSSEVEIPTEADFLAFTYVITTNLSMSKKHVKMGITLFRSCGNGWFYTTVHEVFSSSVLKAFCKNIYIRLTQLMLFAFIPIAKFAFEKFKSFFC